MNNDKTNDLLKFVDLLVKQTCRRAAYDLQVATKHIKEDRTSIYSRDFLKKMHEKPRENVYKLVKNPQKTLKGLRVGNGFNFSTTRKDNRFTKIEQMMLLDFVNKVKDQAPPRQLQWIDLQHYLHYAYRNFACPNPDPSAEVLSTFFINEMRDLVECLRKEDESQLWLRVFALLREYCIFAQWHYSKNDQEHALLKFFCYYEAMLTAAKNLVMVFSDFESQVIFNTYKVCWIDFNTFIFIRFFYESERVKTRLSDCVRTKKSPGDAPQMFALLDDLKRLWTKEQTRVNLINQEGRLKETSPQYARDKRTLAAHKKILGANFWVDREKEERDKLDLSRMDHNLFDLLKDRAFFPEGPGLNKNGQCICEECLIAKYKCYLDTPPGADLFVLRNTDRVTFCRKCKNLVDLDYYHRHTNSHAVSDLENNPKSLLSNRATNLTRIISEKMDFVKLGNGQTNLSDLLNEKLKINDSTAQATLNAKRAAALSGNLKKNDVEGTKLAFEEFLKHTKDNNNKSEQILNKNVRNLIKIKKDIFTQSNGNFDEKVSDGLLKQTCSNSAAVKSEKTAETESRIRGDIRRIGHKPYSTPPKVHNKCTGTDDDSQICQGHGGDPCDHVEPKKCDCTYCEVFGTVHKNAELRDRLRIRLQQRREKRVKETQKQNSVPNLNNVKIKSVISKVETRVPLPSSPVSIPSTPSVSSESSVTNMEFRDDIHGLVNYIEGNTALNKIELAEKKAAKKARQRDRREQERIEAEEELKRKAEEAKRKEEDRKKELERKQVEKKKAEAAAKKKEKKRKQQLKKTAASAVEQQKFTEETIPAMVTIKRQTDDENVPPTVTITLKGYTPDQDKLLYTLVDEPDNAKDMGTQTQAADNNSNKDKKKKKAKPVVPEPPKFVTKEVKVTLAVDKAPPANNTPYPAVNGFDKQTNEKPNEKRSRKDNKKPQKQDEEMHSFGNLKLPPGITITKVEGPVSNYNFVGNDPPKGTTMVGKSGVIVVDTEKLIHKSDTNTQLRPSKLNRRNKRKKMKQLLETKASEATQTEKPKMITLKNPIFEQYQNCAKPNGVDNSDACAPAAIFTSENGMVTIRSSRLQQSLSNGTTAGTMTMPLIPNIVPDKTISNPNSYFPASENDVEKKKEKECVSPLNAQEILSGLPGIEITKVDKNVTKDEEVHSCPDAQVSIIPSSTGTDMDFDKDDWLYDSVFKPRDVLEDDMDAEELELEAFKRFCQQSVPPKRKEKVAHLNVADIVLKKKTDVKFA